MLNGEKKLSGEKKFHWKSRPRCGGADETMGCSIVGYESVKSIFSSRSR